MKRSEIKVGERYAVTNRRVKDPAVVCATVLDTDAEYQGRRSGHSRSLETLKGGIRVRFEEPMFRSFGGFYAVNGREPTALSGDPITEFVLADVKLVVEPWVEHEARMREHAEWRDRARAAADEKGARFKPVLDAITVALDERSMVVTTRLRTEKGLEDRPVPVAASYVLSAGQMAKLLGVEC